MPLHKIEITRSGIDLSPANMTVKIDDNEFPVIGWTMKWDIESIPRLELDCYVREVSFTGEGKVVVNGVKVPDEVAYRIYQKLKTKFEGFSKKKNPVDFINHPRKKK